MAGEKKKARRLIGLVKDGELTEKERSLVEDRIALDPGLEEELKKYELLSDVLDKAKKIEIPASPDLEDAVLERIRSADKEKGRSRFFEGVLTAPRKYTFEIVGAAAAAVLVLFALFRFMPGLTTTKTIAVREELKAGETAPSAPVMPDESAVEGIAPSPQPAETEELVDGTAPLKVHEEPEDVTLAPAGGKTGGTAPGTAPPAHKKKTAYGDEVAAAPAAVESMSKGTAGGFKKSDYSADEDRGMKTLIFRATDERGQPINLVIYTDNPDRVRYDIENKAMELGREDKNEGRFGESYLSKERAEKDKKVYVLRRGQNNIYIPRERVREFLTYIESNYPPTKSQIKELDIDERNSLLNIEFSIPEDKK
jgi:hypothetical protein